MKYLIIGRTGSGKDYIAKVLSEIYNLKILKSYTTRPKRNEQDDGHIFITPEEAATITDRIAEWKLDNGIEYFATAKQFRNNDIYIINPDAAINLFEKLPSELRHVKIIYVRSPSYRKRKQFCITREEDKSKALECFEKRNKAENAEFCKFEQLINNEKNSKKFRDIFYRSRLTVFTNRYNQECIENLIYFKNVVDQIEDPIRSTLNEMT